MTSKQLSLRAIRLLTGQLASSNQAFQQDKVEAIGSFPVQLSHKPGIGIE